MTDPHPEPYAHRLNRLRSHRNRREDQPALQDLPGWFDRQVARPFQKLQGLAEVWEAIIPEHIAGHTRLVSLQRGVLHVQVTDSASLYELDRLLRGGAQQRLTTSFKGTLRKVKLTVAPIDET